MIGPKCQLCKKQLLYHEQLTKACPMGKRLRVIGYTKFHESNRFTPKDPSKGGASEKRKDKEGRKQIRKADFCQACLSRGSDFNPIDCAHVRTWRVTQSNHPANQLSLCRRCHRLQGESWGDFLEVFPRIREVLESMGWEITPDPFSETRVILSHKEIA